MIHAPAGAVRWRLIPSKVYRAAFSCRAAVLAAQLNLFLKVRAAATQRQRQEAGPRNVMRRAPLIPETWYIVTMILYRIESDYAT